MSICIIAMVVFAVMGIFSARYRRWAKEAFGCVSRRLTLRPCNTEFNQKVRAKITGKLMGRSPKAARFAHKHFEAISWVFTIVLILSLAYTSYAVYNLAVYGTCDPITGECVFVPDAPDCGCQNAECLENDNVECGPECACGDAGCEASLSSQTLYSSGSNIQL
jgi:hypothetical protein